VSWWSYAVDYAYITQIGGVAKCFNPKTRSGTPDVGAYEYNGTTGTGGSPGTGGTASGGTPTGGTATGGLASGGKATGGTTVSTGGLATGGTIVATGGTATGGTSTSGGTATGGATSAGGTGGSAGNPEGQGCSCRTAPSQDGYGKLFGLIGLCVLAFGRRRARR
jgi:MYXO-CTERM domain-containing protein